MWNYFDHIKAMFGPYQSHVLAISTISLLLDGWNGSKVHWRDMHAKKKNTIQCQIIGTIIDMLGPCWGHIKAIFWLFLQYLCFKMPEMAQIFTVESYNPNRGILLNVDSLGPYWGNGLAILGPCFGYSLIVTIFGQCSGHIRAMCLLLLQYLCFQMSEMVQIFWEVLKGQNNITIYIRLLNSCWGQVLAIYALLLPLYAVIA